VIRKYAFFIKWLLLIAAVLVGSVILFRSGLYSILIDRGRMIEYVRSFGAAGIAVFILIQIVQVLFAPIPGEVTGFVGGFLYGGTKGLLYSSVGLTLGSLAAFLLGRSYGRPVVERVARKETLDKYDFVMENRGIWVSFLLFLVPGFPKDLFCYLLGTSRMPFGAFLAISAVGRLLGTAMLSMSGSLVRDGEFRLLGLIAVVATLLILASVLYRERLAAWMRSRRRQKKKGSREDEEGAAHD